MTRTLPWWWLNDPYVGDVPIPEEFEELAGPHGVAVVRTWSDGTTDSGWGLEGKDGKPGFMEKYSRKDFHPTRVVPGYKKDMWNFAFVMRSMKMVCIDIDGKNGGIEHAPRLGMLPHTLAETSKSGDGYHLFYTTPDDEWSDETGFALFNDRIGIQQGVDIRATGCVYHYPTQRWNHRMPAPLPAHLWTLLQSHRQSKEAQVATIIKMLDAGDQVDILMMQSKLLQDLSRAIPAGRRNTTLFALGSQLMLAQVDEWDGKILDRAVQVGLSVPEANKLVANIKRYGSKA